MPTFTSDMATGLNAIDLAAVTTDVGAYAVVALGVYVAIISIPFGKKMMSSVLAGNR